MKKVLIGVLLVVFALTLTTALTTTVAADSDNAAEPIIGPWFGLDISMWATTQDPGYIGDFMSDGHEGNKDNAPAYGKGGIKLNLP